MLEVLMLVGLAVRVEVLEALMLVGVSSGGRDG